MDTIVESKLEIDQISKDQWSHILPLFNDATFFQTWEYGAFSWGEENLSHAILKINGVTAAAAQVRIANRLPGLKYAYIAYGPMWRTKEGPENCEILGLMISRLVEEYVRKRRYSLRIFPFIHDGDPFAEKIRNNLLNNGFISSKEKQKTLFLDITLSTEEMKKNLRRKWRQCLRYSEEAGLNITLSKSRKLFVDCLEVYNKMHERKNFKENVCMEDFLTLHEVFPEDCKYNIVAVGKDERIDACLIFSAIGDTGFPVLAATAASGLDNYASYLAYWEMIKYLNGKGIHWFDFRGIDPKGNSGVYYFKTGISGKKGLEVCYLGDFMHYHSNFDRVIMTWAKKLSSGFRRIRSIL